MFVDNRKDEEQAPKWLSDGPGNAEGLGLGLPYVFLDHHHHPTVDARP